MWALQDGRNRVMLGFGFFSFFGWSCPPPPLLTAHELHGTHGVAHMQLDCCSWFFASIWTYWGLQLEISPIVGRNAAACLLYSVVLWCWGFLWGFGWGFFSFLRFGFFSLVGFVYILVGMCSIILGVWVVFCSWGGGGGGVGGVVWF